MKLSDLDKKGVSYSIGGFSPQTANQPAQAQNPGGVSGNSVKARDFGDNLLIGAVKGAAGTLTSTDSLIRKIPGVGSAYSAIAPKPFSQTNAKLGFSTDAKGVAQNIGKGAEQLAEFIVPGSVAGKGIKAYETATAAAKMPKYLKTGLDIGARIAADGTATAVTRTAQTGSPVEGIKEGVVGGLASGVAHGVLSGLKSLAKYQPKVAEFLSGVDQKVFSRQMEDPAKAKAALQVAKEQGTEGVLGHIQKSVYSTRKALTESYDVGEKALVNTYQGVRTGFNEGETKLLKNLAGFYPTLDTAIPQNPQKFSVKEGLYLYKNINEVVGNGSNPWEVTSRAVRDMVKKKLVSSFGTSEAAAVGKFLGDYSETKQSLDAIDSLVSAYKTGNPKAQATAQRAIQNVFNKNQTAYLNAFEDFAKQSGFDHTDVLAALNARQVLPMKSLGNGDFSTSILRSILAPVGASPRASAAISRLLGNMLRGQGALGAAVTAVDRGAAYVAGRASGN
jgi:hypothetical protein